MRRWYADPQAEDIETVCKSLGVSMFETPSVNHPETVELVRESAADLGISLGNSYISSKVFSLPKFGMVNVHMELLPQFRGAQSIIWPIYEGETQTGFTIHRIDKKIDSGAILYKKSYEITFLPTLRQTVERNLLRGYLQVPDALAVVCENFQELAVKSIGQSPQKSYTTPKFSEFLQMVRENRRHFVAGK